MYPILKEIVETNVVTADIEKKKYDFKSKPIPDKIELSEDFLRLCGFYLAEGNMSEEDSIDLFCRIEKKFYQKNTDRIKNDFLSGTPDLYEGENVQNATRIIDIKSSWDIQTFLNKG